MMQNFIMADILVPPKTAMAWVSVLCLISLGFLWTVTSLSTVLSSFVSASHENSGSAAHIWRLVADKMSSVWNGGEGMLPRWARR